MVCKRPFSALPAFMYVNTLELPVLENGRFRHMLAQLRRPEQDVIASEPRERSNPAKKRLLLDCCARVARSQ
jgi:hypothetical protein